MHLSVDRLGRQRIQGDKKHGNNKKGDNVMHPLVGALRDWLDNPNPTCSKCGSTVFDVALEPSEYIVDMGSESAEDRQPFGTTPEIQAVQCHDCQTAF